MADDSTSPFEDFYKGYNYLGRPVSVTLAGQEPTSPAGLSAAGAPVSPSGMGAVGPTNTTIGTAAGSGTSPGLSPALQGLLRAAGLGEKLPGIAENLAGAEGLTGPAAGAVETPSGQLTTSAPEILRPQQFPDPTEITAEGSQTDILGGSGTLGTQPATAATEGTDLLGLAGQALPYLGAGVGTVLGALSGAPPAQQAINDALNFAGAGLAGETFGISALAAPLIEWALSGLFKPGDYAPKRQEAATTATGDLQNVSANLGTGLQSGNPAQVLAALQSPSTDDSSQAGRNPVRTDLLLPPDVAKKLGLTGADVGGNVQVEWGGVTPQQFQGILSAYAADPATFGNYIRGSGDVAYLPAAQAGKVANNAKDLVLQAFNLMTQGQPAAAPTAPAPASTTPTGTEPLQFPTPTGGGQVFDFGP
jgi:hypothetical protein